MATAVAVRRRTQTGARADAQELVGLLEKNTSDEFAMGDVIDKATRWVDDCDRDRAQTLIDKAVNDLGKLARTEDGVRVL